MRVTTLVNKLIGLQGLWVRNFHFQADKAQSGGGCRTTEEEASVRGLRSKGPARTKIATIVTGGTWTCSVSGAIFATRSGEWFVGVVAWSKKRCLGPTRGAALPRASNKR